MNLKLLKESKIRNEEFLKYCILSNLVLISLLQKNYENGFKYLGYIFYTDENGRSAIAQIDYENNIVKNQSYNKVKVNEQSFKKVKNGMNPFDVVKLVGIPFRSVTSGLITLDFKCDDGTVYRIGWSQVHNSENQNAKFTDLEVNEVYKVTE